MKRQKATKPQHAVNSRASKRERDVCVLLDLHGFVRHRWHSSIKKSPTDTEIPEILNTAANEEPFRAARIDGPTHDRFMEWSKLPIDRRCMPGSSGVSWIFVSRILLERSTKNQKSLH